MMRPCFGAILALALGAFSGLLATRAFADDRCQQLLALRAQYAGVELTPDQKVLKVQLVAWYGAHCRGRHMHMAGAD